MTLIEAIRNLDLTDLVTRDLITPVELMQMLVEDVVQAAERPGSWEGANMLQVLTCHGLLEHQD